METSRELREVFEHILRKDDQIHQYRQYRCSHDGALLYGVVVGIYP